MWLLLFKKIKSAVCLCLPTQWKALQGIQKVSWRCDTSTLMLMRRVCAAKLLQLCPTLCDSMDGSPPGSCVHGILQARIPEWATISFSRGSSQPRDQTCISWGSCFADRFFTTEPPGKPLVNETHHTNPVHDNCTDADTPAGREPACFSVSFPNKHLSKCPLPSVLSPPVPTPKPSPCPRAGTASSMEFWASVTVTIFIWNAQLFNINVYICCNVLTPCFDVTSAGREARKIGRGALLHQGGPCHHLAEWAWSVPLSPWATSPSIYCMPLDSDSYFYEYYVTCRDEFVDLLCAMASPSVKWDKTPTGHELE